MTPQEALKDIKHNVETIARGIGLQPTQPTGSADGMIEPKPADGRRPLEPIWEEIEVLKLSVDSMSNRVESGFGTHWSAIRGLIKWQGRAKRKIADLRRVMDDVCVVIDKHEESIATLTATVEQQGRELAEVRERVDFDPGPMPFPTQPAPTVMRFDANGDDAKWEAVHAASWIAYGEVGEGKIAWGNLGSAAKLPMIAADKSAVAEAIRQGLVSPRIDPESWHQRKVVEQQLPTTIPNPEFWSERILSALSQMEVTHG